MSYRLPSLNGLRAFEAAGRHLSFKRAAEELSVTPGAVSQQVKHLETTLGVPLFHRLHRSLVLTGFGETLLPTVSDAFERLSAASDAVARTLETRALRLGVSPRLAADPEALLAAVAGGGRAPDFIRVSRTDEVADLLNGSLDALLRPGPGPYPGLHAEHVALNDAFAPHREASLVVWPGLARCRELLKVKALLGRG
ncbi:LysR family transcriptional regulator [Arenibaculum sp.]|jgi:LysR family glycine cleavage system transcriptional activator|uniref:LysR family transcriptional regulator n=1 Tax=Arenibaculum sp. TaxID=2865862 RepID=UPI002E15D903|nr:LysR family transcriptional regulator [Arenibaculum sp.]